jgi:lysyl-tRNA synthetase class 2
VLEVETPLIGRSTMPDLHIESMRLRVGGENRFLQTSPEAFMKRLLAAGSGSIYQIGRAFREGEEGRRHNPEFTLLEWYRVGFDHHRLMDETDELLQQVAAQPSAERRTYRRVFLDHAGLDPHAATLEELVRRCRDLGFSGEPLDERDDALSFLMTQAVEPHLGRGRPTFVYDFPSSQAALARIRPGSPPVAERFELYADGVELANGFHELTDAGEQRRRFAGQIEERRRRNRPPVPLDGLLLAALEHGLPDCAGVALGIDRLLLVVLGVEDLREVLTFAAERA